MKRSDIEALISGIACLALFLSFYWFIREATNMVDDYERQCALTFGERYHFIDRVNDITLCSAGEGLLKPVQLPVGKVVSEPK